MPARYKSVIESLGIYLPSRVVSTDEVVRGTKKRVLVPLERLTGITSRRMVADDEYSIDLANQAVAECLAMSRHSPDDIEVLICANISRMDGPNWNVSIEPNTAVQVQAQFGLNRAVAFDVSNACAGMWTAINIVDSMIRSGAIRVGMVASGEYISHIIRTAQLEIDGILDSRLACLTVGDAGAALILERSDNPAEGLHDIEMYTLGNYSPSCIGKPTDQEHGGAIMYNDPMSGLKSAMHHGVTHAARILERNNWTPDDCQFFITHQTSRMTLNGVAREINKVMNRKFLNETNFIINVGERGNTATTSHWVALKDYILNGRINSGHNVAFGITGSGLTLGTALYTLDDLPDRVRAQAEGRAVDRPESSKPESAPESGMRGISRARIAGLGRVPDDAPVASGSVEFARLAAEDCLTNANLPRHDVDLLINTGVHRDEFIFEPAMASLIAGALHLNDDIETHDQPKTFALDLFNGAIGFLNGCFVASEMIKSGRAETAMVVTSEIENNRSVPGQPLRGIRETGSALLLEQDSSGDVGFGAFAFHTFTEHVNLFHSHTAQIGATTFIEFSGDPRPEDLYLQLIPEVVYDVLAREELEPARVSVVIPPQISASFSDQLGQRLGLTNARFVTLPESDDDLYTSTIVYGLRHVYDTQLVKPGDIGLIISVAAGIQVGCAVYRF